MASSLSHLSYLAYFFLAIALAGTLYSAAAFLLVRRLGSGRCQAVRSCLAVTILKPLHGAEPHLYENLASFCRLEYDGEVQIILGVQDAGDPAINIVRRLVADFPCADIKLVVDSQSHGANRKISNLINMARFARNDVLII